MAGSSTASWWQYSRWVWNISRNARISEPTGAELTAVKTFIKAIYNPMTQTGTRPWLKDKFQRKAVQVPGDTDYQCDIDQQPTHVLVELVGVIGRNLDGIPLTDAEKTLADALIAATGNRRYGTGALFGGTSGSLVTVP